MRSLLLASASLLVLLAPRAAEAQFVVDGVIHDAARLVPLEGVSLFVVDDQTGVPISPGELLEPSQQGQISGADGRYRFGLRVPSRAVRIQLERPSARFIFPSVTRRPDGEGPLGGVACLDVPCPQNLLGPTPAPQAGGRYALRFRGTPGLSALNNHLPVDTRDDLVRVELTADRARVRRGDQVPLRARVVSETEALEGAELVVTLSPELRALPETVQARLGGAEDPELAPRQRDLQLRFPARRVRVGAALEVHFLARAIRLAPGSEARVRAWLEGPGGVPIGAEAEVRLRLEEDPTLDQSTILGQVYCEGPGGREGWVDEGEQGLFGARVYLDTGFYAQTDPDGLFHFSGVPPGTRLVKLDEQSLPPGSAVIGAPRAQLYLSPGTPAKVRFGVDCRLEAWRTPATVTVPEGAPEGPPAAGSRTLEIAADLQSRTVRVDGRAFDLLFPSLEATPLAEGLRLYPRLLGGPLPERWTLRVERVDAEGRVVERLGTQTLTGPGLPPLFVDLKVAPPPGGSVRAALELAREEEMATSPAVEVAPLVDPEPELLATVSASEGDPEGGLRALLPELEARLARGPGRLRVVGHWDGSAGEAEAEASARRLTELAARVLAGLPAERLDFEVAGARAPLVPASVSARLQRRNRRLELLWIPPPAPKPAQPPVEAALVVGVDGKEAVVPLDGAGQTRFTADLDVPARLALVLRDGRGGESELVLGLAQGRTTRPGQRPAQVPVLEPGGGHVRLGSVRLPVPPAELWLSGAEVIREGDRAEIILETGGAADVAELVLELRALDGRRLAVAAGEGLPRRIALVVTASAAFSAETRLELLARHRAGHLLAVGPVRVPPLERVASGARLELPPRGLTEVVAGAEAPADRSERLLWIGEGTRVALPVPPLPFDAPLEAKPVAPPPEDTPASEIELLVPAAGQVLSRLSYPITGRTRPENRLTVNGRPVEVAPDGRFAHTLPLAQGENRVRIESVDEAGNRAVFERAVETSSSAWFLMALAEGQVSTGGARLAGSNDQTHTTAGAFGLDGRLLAYGRARFTTEGPFRAISLVGRLDTGDLGAFGIRRLEDDPLRLLGAFGDLSTEVQDVASRYPLYLAVEADDSRLVLGNGTTSLSTVGEHGLFTFRRAGFGVHADVVKSFGEDDQSRVTGVVTFGNDGIARQRDELQGTGGALYWLSRKDVVEGSERVRIVVRDRDTGLVLAESEKARGLDYELRPREGRVMLRQPLSHVVLDAQTAMNRSVALTGHPVYLVVDYEHHTQGVDDTSFGVSAKERIGSVELSAALAGEDRLDDRHRIYGAGVVWRPGAASYVELEWAGSSGRTSLGRLSVDGGLSFLELDRRIPSAEATARAEDGILDSQAFGAAAQLDFSDLSAERRGHVRAWGRRTGLYFSALGAARSAGRIEGGASASYGLGEAWTLRARFDAAEVALPAGTGADALTEIPAAFRGLGVVGADWQRDGQGVSFEAAHLITDGTAGLTGSATGLSARWARQYSSRFGWSVTQDALLSSDPHAPEGLSALATTVGARLRLDEHLSLDAAQMVRWNGDNATQLGLRVETEEGLAAYVAERFSSGAAGPTLTTVVGAEDRVAAGSRTFGEIQVDGAADPGTTRAVLGMDNRWRVAEDLELLLAYERAMLAAGHLVHPSGAPNPFSAPFGGLAATLGGFGQATRLLPGAVSRDALALGATWTPLSRLRLSSRVELRVDDGDEAAGGRDFFVLGVHAGASFRAHRDVTALGRITYHHARDTTRDETWARALEWSLGAALRPKHEDWFTLLVRYTRLENLRPQSDADGLRVAEQRDALSVEPIFDTPWRVQLVERFALVRSGASVNGGPEARGMNLLWINRLNARVHAQFEAGLEYRMLVDLGAETAERGALVEAGWIPDERIRLGLGYNFTRFSDEVLTLTSRDASGPFVRMTARY